MALDLIIPPAQAQQQADPAGDMLFFLIFTVVLVAIFYFLLIRPQRKRMKEHEQMVQNLEQGDEVVTSGGVLGRITRLGEQFVRVEVAEGVEWHIKRDLISTTMPKGTLEEARGGGQRAGSSTESTD